MKIKPAFFLCGLYFVLAACEQSAEENSPAAETTASSQSIVAEKDSETLAGAAPTADDMANLAAAMGGAKDQQPDDAPKDKYGNPYIIGNLGGFPANLPASVVHLVEYEDSPGWDMEALRNYHPPVRSYDSAFTSFGFYFRNDSNEIYDNNNHEMLVAYEKRTKIPLSEDDWIDVGVQSGSRKSKPGWLDRIFAAKIDPQHSSIPWNYWISSGEFQFGLERYFQPESDPDTGKKWRDRDLFIYQDENGKVQTYIECSTAETSAYPSCEHRFNFPPPMQVDVRLGYGRHQLANWREIEAHTIAFILGFKAENYNYNNSIE